MSTKIGALRKQVKFQKPGQVSDGRGGFKKIPFSDYETVRGGLKPKTSYRDRETENEQQQQSSMTYILTIRFRSDITPNMRALVDNMFLYITKPPYDPDGHRRWLNIECEARSQ